MEYQLKDTFEYAKGAETVTAETITVTAPKSKIMKKVGKIDSQLNIAMLNISESVVSSNQYAQGQKEESEVTASDYVQALKSGRADMDTCFDAFRQIMIDTAKVNGETSLTSVILDKISYRDITLMLGEYIKNFLSISQVD